MINKGAKYRNSLEVYYLNRILKDDIELAREIFLLLLEKGEYVPDIYSNHIIPSLDDTYVYVRVIEKFPNSKQEIINKILLQGSIKLFLHVYRDIENWVPAVINLPLMKYIHENGYHNMRKTKYMNYCNKIECVTYLLDIGTMPDSDTIHIILGLYVKEGLEELLLRILTNYNLHIQERDYSKILEVNPKLFVFVISLGYSTYPSLLINENKHIKRTYELIPAHFSLRHKHLIILALYNENLFIKALQERDIEGEEEYSDFYQIREYENLEHTVNFLHKHGLYLGYDYESIEEHWCEWNAPDY